MSELGELYQEVILDHNKQPRNFRVLPQPTHQGVGHNPLCGDRVLLYLHVQGGVVKDISFQGAGCAISTASASLLTEALKGKTVVEAETLYATMHAMLTAEDELTGEELQAETLGKLVVFSGVREFPMRVKCASLAWHTLHSALGQQKSGAGDEPISTE